MRATFKAIISILCMLYLVLVSSCLQPEAYDGREIISVLAYGDNSGEERALFLTAVKEFERNNPEIRISYQMYQGDMYFRMAKQRISNGNIPDIYYGGPDARWSSPWAENNLQFDHRPYLDIDHYDLSMIPNHGTNGEIYNIPLGSTNITSVLFANQTLLDRLDLPLPKTYSDLLAMVPIAQRNGIDVVSFNGQDDWAWGACFLSTYAVRFTGDPSFSMKAASGERSYRDPGFIAALEAAEYWMMDGVFSSDVLTTGYEKNIRDFSNGRALFMLQGQWVADEMDADVAENTVITALPIMEQEAPNTRGYTAGALAVGYGMTKSAGENPVKRQMCMELIDILNSRERVSARLAEGEIVAPVVRNVRVPNYLPNITKQKIDFALSLPGTTGVIDAFLNEDANNALNNGVQQIALGTRSAEYVARQVERLARD